MFNVRFSLAEGVPESDKKLNIILSRRRRFTKNCLTIGVGFLAVQGMYVYIQGDNFRENFGKIEIKNLRDIQFF